MAAAIEMPPIGQIEFVGRGNPEPSRYIVLPSDAAKGDMEPFVEQLKTKFGLNEGKVLLSVTGGAQDFKMSPSKLEQVFTRGIIRAAKNSSGWIVTGGLDAGVMRFVGDAARKQFIGDLPRIGIATYKKVSHYEEIENSQGEKVHYLPKKVNDQNSAALNPNHTHFILVDSPIENWGQEIPVRTALEDFITTALRIPLVLIVVNGGPGTIDTIAEGIKKLFPIIIVDGSGRAADAIASLLRGNNEAWGQLTKNMDAKKSQAYMDLILNGRKLITLYNPDDDASCDMDLAILRAVLSGSRKNDTFESKVMLAIEWGRADIVGELFETEDETGATNGSNRLVLNNAMQKALELDQPAILRLLVEKGANKAAINMKALYQLDEVKYLMERLLPFSHSKLIKFGLGRQPSAMMSNVDFAEASLALHHEDFANDMGGSRSSEGISRELHTAKKILNRIDKMYFNLLANRQTSYTDMLVWAIMVNRHDLAKEIWRNSVLPIHSALVACHIYRTLAEWFEGEDDYPTSADWFEAQAVKVFDTMEYDVARKVMEWKWTDLDNKNPLQIAQLANAKDFMSHQFVQRYLGEILYSDEHGSLTIGCNTVTVLRAIFMPYWSPYKKKENTDARFYHIYYLPITKFWTSTISYLLFLLLLAAVVILSGSSQFLPIEFVLWAWIGSMVWEEVRQFLSEKESYFFVISNQMDCVMLLLLALYIALRISGVVMQNGAILIASTDILVVATIWCYVRLLYVFAFSQALGPLFFAMVKMINDVAKWVFVFSVFMVSFQIGVMALTDQAGQPMWQAYPNGTFAGTFFTIVGDFNEAMTVMAETNVGVAFLGIYVFIAQVVLVNLLIAMMGDTYSQIKENSAKEWKFFLYSIVFDYCQCSAYPPPFGLVINPISYVVNIFSPPNKKDPAPNNLLHSIEEMTPPADDGSAGDSTDAIKDMKLAKERVLEQDDEEEIHSNESLAKNINLLKRQRENDRVYFEQQFQSILTALAQFQNNNNK